MINETAAQVLNDLIQLNNERISRYEALIQLIAPGDAELRFIFAGIIGESHQNKISLATELQAMGEYIHLSPVKKGKLYEAALLRMQPIGEPTRLNILTQTDVFEAAVLLGYEFSLQSDDVAAYLRDILVEQESKIRVWHQHIKHMREKLA